MYLEPNIPRCQRRTSCTESHDALGWTVGCSYLIDGYSLGLRANDHDLLAYMMDLIPLRAEPARTEEVRMLFSFQKGAPSPRRGVRHYHHAYVDCERLHRTLDLEDAKARVAQELRKAVNRFAIDRVCLRGSVLVFEGIGLAILSEQAPERDALLNNLIASGAQSYSEGCILIDSSGRLATWNDRHPPLSPGLLVRVQSESPEYPASMSAGQMTLGLFAAREPSTVAPPHLMPILAKFAQSARGYDAHRGNASQLLAFIKKGIPDGD